jgi:P4 family phage/plasmid primase-like protien
MPVITKIQNNSFDKYLIKFIKNTETVQTHLSFKKGKYNVSDEEYDEFYKNYYDALIKNEKMYLIEKIHNNNFAFFMDIDTIKDKGKENLNEIYFSDEDINIFIKIVCDVIDKNFIMCNKDDKLTDYILSKRDQKYHINFYNLVVNDTVAKNIVKQSFKILTENNVKYIDYLKCIDCSVYRTGLRMLGSFKNETEEDCYKIYNIEKKEYINNEDISYDLFLKTIVRKKENEQMTKLKKNTNFMEKQEDVESNKVNKIQVKGVDNYDIVEEINRLLQHLKNTCSSIENMDLKISRIYAAQNKFGMFCYYISINEKFCPFKQRKHKRESSPIYLEIGINGIFIKCHDHDCLRQRFPNTGIKMPDDFESLYPQLYLSMTTKYWKTEITINDEIRNLLEESLIGSHYQIAKTVFNIYKERFRVDDVKNTTWFEFDGVRWKKSHIINILISEELPKYYNGIKISDTSVVKDNDLKEYLINNEKMDANFRNSLVDKIIAKLENVTFKGNVLTQTSYLYKNNDPDFYSNLDENPYLLGFSNGVYDFKINKFRESTQNDYITFSTGYEYLEYDESHNEVNEIYDFLAKIITNKKVREYLLKVLGKSLLGIPDEKFYIWTGLSGANGKSTLINFLENTLGEYITSVDVSLLTNRRANSSNASPDIIRLRGKRMFTFQEPEHDDKLRTGILKQFTGGDTIIARELFKAPISFKLQGTMIMCCNDLPTVLSSDGGTWRRIRVIEFKSRFCDNPIKENEFKIDPKLKFKLKTWRPYFMSILIHWYKRYLEEGLQEPDEVMEATNKYKIDNDKFNEFFNNYIEENPDHFETNKNVYSQFSNWWCVNYPNTKLPDFKDFRRACKIKYGNEKEQYINGIKQQGFPIKFKQQFETDFDTDTDI